MSCTKQARCATHGSWKKIAASCTCTYSTCAVVVVKGGGGAGGGATYVVSSASPNPLSRVPGSGA